ncbi:glycosyltransferase family 2 protein [Halorubrum sp. BV1]|uniref:glycosyltransferase family 2 protein n=1 Tax=Halorubrum sp. BV1 TaxID=1498500 RepID=UPI0009B5B48B|nr:glycosyltransferase family 2 protein [Halorubrum sp. BV1]
MNISVIITSHNEAKYISDAIESVLNQNKEPDEIILVDAGSTDGTRSIIDSYEQKYQHAKSVYIPASINIPEMRNIALENVNCDLVTFLDGDDRFRPNKLKIEHQKYIKNPDVGIVYSNIRNIDSGGNSKDIWFNNSQPPTGKILAENASRDWPTRSLYRNELISTNIIRKIGMYDENLTVYEDWDLKIRAAAETKVDYCQEVLTEYRHHRDSISNRLNNEEKYNASQYIYNKNKPLIIDNLSSKRAMKTLQSMEEYIIEYSVRMNREERNYISMLLDYYSWLHKSEENKYNIGCHASLLLPNYIKSIYHKISG